jgi:flavin-dependent dehydrogenase
MGEEAARSRWQRPAWDLVVIGAGPAGLGAACMGAERGLRTLVLERTWGPESLGHPCTGVVAPVPGHVSGRRDRQGICFPALGLRIPFELIVGRPTTQLYVSPSGHTFGARFPDRIDVPVAAVDKGGLLRLLKERAEAHGAVIKYRTPVSGLIEENNRITGVNATGVAYWGRAIVSAEGTSRRFCQQAALYDDVPPPQWYVFVVSQKLLAPAADAGDVGQITTVGGHECAFPSFGTVLVPTPGMAQVHYAVLRLGPEQGGGRSLWSRMEKYKRQDPRVRDLLCGSSEVNRLAGRMVVRKAPRSSVRHGFVGAGDAIAPGGQAGIIPSILLGQRAAAVIADALDSGDVSAEALRPYQRLVSGSLLRGMAIESRMLTGLATMSDGELDRVAETLSRVNLATFFVGRPRAMLRATTRWLFRALPMIYRDRHLLARILEGA